MRLASKLSMFACMTVSLAMTAGSASAQISAYSEPGNEGCGEVTIEDSVVSGGCHVEAESTGDVWLFAHTPARTPVSACDVYTEGVVGQDGAGYITNAVLSAPQAAVPCTRWPCDLPWPAQISEQAAGTELVEVTFCLVGPGGGGSSCTLHIEPFVDNTHDWQVGGSEYFCESAQPYPTSIEGDFGVGPGNEGAEVVHDSEL